MAVAVTRTVASRIDPGTTLTEIIDEETGEVRLMIEGIDVSQWQGDIDWPAVRAAGVQFAFIRLSDGLHYPDTAFQRNWEGAGAAGILRSVYQFFRPGQDALEQARLVAGAPTGELLPAIDVEVTDGRSPAELAAGVRTWVDHVGRSLVYTSPSFWTNEVGGANEKRCPLWVAHWTSAAAPIVPPPWTTWAFWQYTNVGRVDGISVDVDRCRFNGSSSWDLRWFAATPTLETLAGVGLAWAGAGILTRGGGPLK